MAEKNKIRFGLRNVYYAVLSEATDGTTFGTPKAWKGARSLSISPEGDTSSYYADDTIYVSNTVNNGYSGTLTMAKDETDFLVDVMGYIKATNGLAEDANVLPKPFALLFECQGDAENQRYVFYKCIPGRSSFEANTKEETIAPDEEAIDITVAPIEAGEHQWVKNKVVKGDEAYNDFFTKVELPKLTETAE